MDYQNIDVKPVSGALGAEIFGVDLSRPLDNRTFSEIRQAFDENIVIFFRDQNITPQQHLDFGARFSAFDIHPFAAGLPISSKPTARPSTSTRNSPSRPCCTLTRAPDPRL